MTFGPLIVTLELTDHCNFRCRMCDQVHGPPHGEPGGFMDPDLFAKALEDLAELPAELLTPYWVGESLLHPSFDELFRAAFARNSGNRLFRHLSLNTNAALLDEPARAALLAAAAAPDQAPDTFVRLHFSIDAAHPPTYRRIKGGGDLAETVERVRAFLTDYRAAGLAFPKFNLAIIAMDENRAECGQFIREWSAFLDELGLPYKVAYDWPEGCDNGIYLRRMDSAHRQAEAERLHRTVATELGLIPPDESRERIIRTNAVLKTAGADHNRGRRPCAGPFKTPIVHWSGRVTVCCFDVRLQLVLGDLNRASLREIWTGAAAHRLRMAHLRGDLAAHPACSGCTNLNTPLLSDDEIRAYLRATGEPPGRWAEGAAS